MKEHQRSCCHGREDVIIIKVFPWLWVVTCMQRQFDDPSRLIPLVLQEEITQTNRVKRLSSPFASQVIRDDLDKKSKEKRDETKTAMQQNTWHAKIDTKKRERRRNLSSYLEMILTKMQSEDNSTTRRRGKKEGRAHITRDRMASRIEHQAERKEDIDS